MSADPAVNITVATASADTAVNTESCSSLQSVLETETCKIYNVIVILTVSTRAADAWCPPCCSPCSSRAWWGRGSSTSSTSSWWSSVSTPVPGYPSLAPAAGYCPWTRLPTGCYQYFQDQQNWTAAQHLCRTRGGRLAELEGETKATWPRNVKLLSQPINNSSAALNLLLL